MQRTGKTVDGMPMLCESQTMPMDYNEVLSETSLCFTIKDVGDIELSQGKYILGRSDEADIKIDDRSVSRRHAEILVLKNQVVIVDLESSNGTYVNGEKIVMREVAPGETVRFGKIHCLLRWNFVPGSGKRPSSSPA